MDQFKVNDTRSPMTTKAVDHTYGAKNLPSDEIGALVNNTYMTEAAEISRLRSEVIA